MGSLNDNKLKMVHIHSDKKFLKMVEDFNHPSIENEIILIGITNKEQQNFCTRTFFETKKDCSEIIDICNSSNAIVIYNLDNFKSTIINNIHSDVKIIWRFFGSELYKQLPKKMYSPLTLNMMSKSGIIQKAHKILLKCVSVILSRKFHRLERKKAMSRIDYMITISELEHKYINNIWPQLPPYIQAPYSHHAPKFTPLLCDKNPIMIVGHSRSMYNNHLDVIKILQTTKIDNFSFIFFFSYGDENLYTSAVRFELTKLDNVKLVEEFLSKDQFQSIYKNAASLVINSYRQLGGSNIMEALKNGVKIYLNKKNLHFKFLTDHGFHVFEINLLKKDLLTNNIMLTQKEMIHNINMVSKLASTYTKTKFQSQIISAISGKKEELNE